MLEEKIQADIVSAMKEKDSVRLSATRSIKAAITESKTAKGGNHNPTDADILKIIQKCAKQRKDAIAEFTIAGRQDLVDKESAELAIIEQYLPQMMSEEEVGKAVLIWLQKEDSKGVKYTMKEMGKVMGALKQELAGKADTALVSKYVKQYLSM